MRNLALDTYVSTPADSDVSRITDLVLGPPGTLYATTNYDGWVSAWDINGTGLTSVDQSNHNGPLVAGAVPGLTLVQKGAAPALLSGGHNGGNMSLRALDSDASFAGLTNLGTTTRAFGPLVDPVTLSQDGLQIVYGGMVTPDGIAQLTFDADGDLISTATQTSAPLRALTLGSIAGKNALFTATDASISTWLIGPSGALTLGETLTPADGLWISDATALRSATIAGTPYLILAAAGSSSLSVIKVAPSGALSVVDHLLDDRNTRFAGASVVETVTLDGIVHVITGGADDGISVFALLPGGRLLARAHIADTPEMGLANISALAGRARSGGLDIFVASAAEPGLTRLRYDAADTTLIAGTSLHETLTGGTGDDIILDGAGRDTLFGGAGADHFVLAADDSPDTIADFTPGEDKVDLSGWAGLAGINQLFLTPTATGITITYGDETLNIITATGTPLQAGALTDTDLLGGRRVPQQITAGLAGPVTDPPDLPERPDYDPPSIPQDPVESGIDRIGTPQPDRLTGSAFNDTLWGLSGQDTLHGGAGPDMLYGGSDADDLRGGDGDDWLIGGGGRDMGWIAISTAGRTNGDYLYGEGDDDVIYGMAGTDRLAGGAGDDVIWGGAGRDTFIFTKGVDDFMDVSAHADTVLLKTDLWSGQLGVASVIDRYGTQTGDDAVLDFGNGDRLTVVNLTLAELVVITDFL